MDYLGQWFSTLAAQLGLREAFTKFRSLSLQLNNHIGNVGNGTGVSILGNLKKAFWVISNSLWGGKEVI